MTDSEALLKEYNDYKDNQTFISITNNQIDIYIYRYIYIDL